DRLREQYKQVGSEQKHVFGEGIPGSKPPDFTKMQGVRGASPLPSLSPAVPPKAPAPANGVVAATPQKSVAPQAAAPNGGSPGVSASVEPKSKPRPTAPILVTDPTDADPGSDVVPPPAPKSEKPPSGAKPATGPAITTPPAAASPP